MLFETAHLAEIGTADHVVTKPFNSDWDVYHRALAEPGGHQDQRGSQ